MHPRDSASREIRHRCPTKIPPLKTTAKGPVAEIPQTGFHSLRTALKTHHQLRLPRPLFLGECKCGTTLRYMDTSDTVSPTEVRQRPRTQCRKQGRFYLLAEPFHCPTIGEPLTQP